MLRQPPSWLESLDIARAAGFDCPLSTMTTGQELPAALALQFLRLLLERHGGNGCRNELSCCYRAFLLYMFLRSYRSRLFIQVRARVRVHA
jgi:hypothetical protein